ncbi:hypothetical protein [Peribacillus sp. NPDC058075]|uniref:hypothetical protein n=1 Tax=unclassified Peribacillus TaxID=2675266 RepID=UPI0036DF63A4
MIPQEETNSILIEFAKSLISSPGTRFPRAVRGPGASSPGVSLGLAFPAGVSTFRSNQLRFKIQMDILLSTNSVT